MISDSSTQSEAVPAGLAYNSEDFINMWGAIMKSDNNHEKDWDTGFIPGLRVHIGGLETLLFSIAYLCQRERISGARPVCLSVSLSLSLQDSCLSYWDQSRGCSAERKLQIFLVRIHLS